MIGLKFDENGLVPVVVQDNATNEVLMVAWANMEAINLMESTGFTHFWSRSRGKIWRKGEESGHVQEIVNMHTDCDGDTLLVHVRQTGVACHTGEATCFHNLVMGSDDQSADVIPRLRRTLRDRLENPKDGSYTCQLYNDETKMCKKVIEEAGEFVLALKDGDKDEMAWELADLIYHTMVVVEKSGLSMEMVYKKLSERKR